MLVLPDTVCQGQAEEELTPLLEQLTVVKDDTGHAPDTNHIQLLNKIAKQYLFMQPDSTLHFAKQALDLASTAGYLSGEALALNNIGNALYVKGSYPKALKAYIKSHEIYESLEYSQMMAWAVNNIGLIYIAQEDFDDAIRQYEKIINTNTNQDSLLFSTAYFNLGLCYSYLDDFNRTIEYLYKSLHISRKIGSKKMTAMALNRIGETYNDNKKFNKAIDNYRQVLEKNYQNNWETSFAHGGLSKAYFETGHIDAAIEHGLKSFELARAMKTKWDAARVLKILSDAYAAKEEYTSAYKYHVLYKQYSDSLYSKAKEEELNGLRLEQQNRENVALVKANEISRQKNEMNRLLIILISLNTVFLIFLIFRIYRSNRLKTKLNDELQKKNENIATQKNQITEQNRILEGLNQTKDKLLSIISHDFRSPLASIQATLNLIRLGALSSDEQKIVFSGLHNKVITISQMLDNLLNWANSQQMGIKVQLTLVDFSAAIQQVIAIAKLLANEKNIQINHSLPDKVFIYADLNHVRIIIQNLISNAIKFTHQGGVINITLSEKNNYYIIHVIDNGIGMPGEKLDKLFKTVGNSISDAGTDSEGGTGIGLMLIGQFIRENHGKVEILSEVGKGTEVKVYFRKQ